MNDVIIIITVAALIYCIYRIGYTNGVSQNIEAGKFSKALDALLLMREKLVLEKTHEALLHMADKRGHTLNIGEINSVMLALDNEHPLPTTNANKV
jgi:hypothetical protein